MPSGMTLTGDWRRLRSFLSQGSKAVDEVNQVIEEEAEEIARAVRGEIPYDEVPNATATIKRKGFNAPLSESGVLASEQGIVVTEHKGVKNYKSYFTISGNPNLQVTSGGRKHGNLTYEKLLFYMEVGVSNSGRNGQVSIPSRPILTITFDRYKGKVYREIIMKFEQTVGKYWNGRG